MWRTIKYAELTTLGRRTLSVWDSDVLYTSQVLEFVWNGQKKKKKKKKIAYFAYFIEIQSLYIPIQPILSQISTQSR